MTESGAAGQAAVVAPVADSSPAAGRRYLLVQLEAGLPSFRSNGLVHAIQQHPGVSSVTDLSAISRDTLDGMLLPVAKTTGRTKAVA